MEKCRYRLDCMHYNRDNTICQFFNNICPYQKEYIRIDNLVNISLSLKGIENIFNNGELNPNLVEKILR